MPEQTSDRATPLCGPLWRTSPGASLPVPFSTPAWRAPHPRRLSRSSRPPFHGPFPLGALLLLLAAACSPSSPADPPAPAFREAQSEPEALHPEAAEAISRLRSPFCPGFMLEVCTTSESDALRDSIQAGALAGLDADSLMERMIAVYGEEYRAFPKRTGAGLLAWAMPPVALLAGLGLVVVALRRMRRGGPVPASEALSDEEQARLDEALAAFESREQD